MNSPRWTYSPDPFDAQKPSSIITRWESERNRSEVEGGKTSAVLLRHERHHPIWAEYAAYLVQPLTGEEVACGLWRTCSHIACTI